MKAPKKWLKIISLFFTVLILFQSCATFKTHVTLEQAVQDEKSVKIITVTDDSYKYKYIVYEDGLFYGVKDNPGEDVKFPINADEVAEVLKKEGLSTWAMIAIIAIPVIIIAYILIKDAIYKNMSFDIFPEE
ncbi:hypothetical protein [uncultured Maribacter sp.]|uniref:hypothetical protein n=1 Tax=uncultured Maribacter sp. TaxID=431308 RepID=UPI0030DA307B|tara:strand:+ start:475 stop:870 length:396 start_codon:yes stop_codon:yes gene_type:complete